MKRFGTLIVLVILCALLLLPYVGVQIDALFHQQSLLEDVSDEPAAGPPRLRSATGHARDDLPAIEELLKESRHGQD